MLDVLRRTDDPAPACTSSARRSARPTSRRCAPSSRSSGWRDAVTLAGSVSGAELEAYFRAADVFVMASDHEGFCVPLAEAMGHGVPIVAYGVTAVPETVGGAGLVLRRQVAGAVRRRRRPGAARRHLREVLAAAGRDAGGGFDLAASTQRFVSLVQQAVGALSRLAPEPGPRPAVRTRSAATRSTARSPAEGRSRASTRRAAASAGVARSSRVAAAAGDRFGQRVRIGGVDQQAGVADHLGQRAGRGWPRPASPSSSPRARAPRSPRGARSPRGRPTPAMAAASAASLSAPVKVTASCRPMLVDEAMQRGGIGRARPAGPPPRASPPGRHAPGRPAAP